MEYEMPCEPSNPDAMACNVTARDCIRRIRELPEETSQIMCLAMVLGMYLHNMSEIERFGIITAILGTLPDILNDLKPIKVH